MRALRLVLDTRRARRAGPAGLVEDPAELPVVEESTPMGQFDDWVTDTALTADHRARAGRELSDTVLVTTWVW